MGKPITIIKIGGSIITKKDSNRPTLQKVQLRRICKEIANAYKKAKDRQDLLIVHGAGSYGHVIVKKTGIDKGIQNAHQLLAFGKTQQMQNVLNSIVVEELLKQGVPAFPFQCSSHAIMKNRQLDQMTIAAIEGLVSIGMVPVAYGVPAYDTEQACSILSGDVIAPFLAQKLRAKKIIHATDVDGVCSEDPKKYKKAFLIAEITEGTMPQVTERLTGSVFTDVTGGMLNKVSQLASLSKQGIVSMIVNGTKKGRIQAALLDQPVEGTVIR